MKKLFSLMILVLAVTFGLQIVDESIIYAYTIKLQQSGQINWGDSANEKYRERDITVGITRAFVTLKCKYCGFTRIYEDVVNTPAYFILVRAQEDDMEAHSVCVKFYHDYNMSYKLYHINDTKIKAEIEEEKRKIDKEIEKVDKENFEYNLKLGEDYYSGGYYKGAEPYYTSARKINGNKMDEFCNELIKNGDNLYNQKLYDAAIDYYRKATVMGSQRAKDKLLGLFNLKGDNLFNQKLYNEAAYYYGKASEFGSQRAKDKLAEIFNLYIAEGDKYYAVKDYENARKTYQQARQINGSKIDEYCTILINNGDNLSNQKLYNGAADYYMKAKVMGNQNANDKLINNEKTKFLSEINTQKIKYEEFNGHCYSVYNVRMDWVEARNICWKLGGHLVTITSQREQNFINELIKKGTAKCYWIGGFSENNKWKWLGNEKFKYKNWAQGEPTNVYQGSIEDRLMIYQENGLWNDESNVAKIQGTFGFICEWESKKDIKNL